MILIDDFLDKNLYSEVLGDSSFFPESMGSDERLAVTPTQYHDSQVNCFAPFMFWDGWWRSEANTLRKRIVQKIWENNLPCPKKEIVGFEYWTRTHMPGQFLDVHVDEDTFMYVDHKVFTGPFSGSVYYGIDNRQGGFLEIHRTALIDGTPEAIEWVKFEPVLSPIEERERIAYKGNRLIIFDAGHVIHSTTAAKSGVRQVMVTNLWHKDNPPRALEQNKFYYE